jgi:predicted LPLAT superfamily acyltransferase
MTQLDAEPPVAWATRRERGTAATIKLIVWLALRLGRSATRLLLFPICVYFLVFSMSSRKASLDYLRRALGREPRLSDCFRHYHRFAGCVLDRVYLLNDQLDLLDVHVNGEEVTVPELVKGRGCFLFGAHLGSFEILRAMGHRHRHEGLKLSLLMYEENARKINAALNAINPALALEIIALGQPDSILTVEERLEAGHFIGILADRGMRAGDDEYMRVDFLGAPARFPLAPFRLAAVMRRPVILMVGLFRGGRRYEVYFETLADFSDLPREARDAQVEEALRRYVARIEYYCRLDVYNWFNIYDFWK